ncbi:hypothetical protein Pint_26777 [Pistacia integerrima]|uniref:Uncharacterized protein n=1 Tax=Pistacia integerrima TaxID=434235 RepID=A0ACC0YS92_9ROSI|nr:hypothetical protein Pint_26777 [Pistacia integerrima]
MKAVSKVFNDFLENFIDEHVQCKDENRNKDFVDVMLSFLGSEEIEHKIERHQIKAILVDTLVAATDTSGSTIEWTLSELIKHLEIMEEVQKELENVVGLDRMVEESDLDNLEYLDMVVKETLRLNPVIPLLLLMNPWKIATVAASTYPKNHAFFINVWAIGRDP